MPQDPYRALDPNPYLWYKETEEMAEQLGEAIAVHLDWDYYEFYSRTGYIQGLIEILRQMMVRGPS